MKKIAISLLFLSIIILLFIFVNSNYASNFLKILSGNIKLENKEIDLKESMSDYQRLIQLNKHMDELFKKKFKEIFQKNK